MAIPTYNGSTIPVVTIQPNEDEPIKFGANYSTTISEALDTTEERQTRRPRPLYDIDFTTFTLTEKETAYLRTIMETAEALPVAVPIWPLKTKLAAAVSAGATSLVTDSTADCMFHVFYQYAILWESFELWEVVELDLTRGFPVPEFSMALSAALANNYSTEAFLIPLMYGALPREDMAAVTDELATWDCKFKETFHRLHDQSVPEVTELFDNSLCAITTIGGDAIESGGDSFECYALGAFETLPIAGTGFSGGTMSAENEFNQLFGDTFESYASSGTLGFLIGGTGWSSEWCHSDG